MLDDFLVRAFLAGAYEDGRAEPRAILSVAAGFVGKLLALIFGVIGLALGSMALAVVVAVVTFIRRQRGRAAANPPAAAG